MGAKIAKNVSKCYFLKIRSIMGISKKVDL